ncbi:hypothetical protein CLAFUW4_04394 [Fulvia fulva]|uniref:Het-C-domain-containing protein n=1 Tax=Passalora fulva TaxID=5499 RepID=A0A9Q8LE15_PASFU|nr:uncharacterized protein CLAFUR5_04357 [Fulvia fulva]KAK4626414.1 hypothetical protein CLAFUR4_04380 [Fulvia fulva]UJO15693.1 hypothetical protein CLAFUR5_04357 [Fulvia fulva]WPV14112.1 hypothetical protein CLAFUW4_04394 [Fulvia fulva]WPV28184.1 hypothetical protein CLAFUW7_04384 [Fulvia fulva]
MAIKYGSWLPILALCLVLYARPTHAFGAGNIGSTSKIEGQNWRHGDIEDTLLTLLTARAMGGEKFSKLDVKRVYFGNWLRDYSQAVDVGTVKYVSAEAIRLLLWILGFMSFGYGTGEFEVTKERLGVYRPEEHIDNPRDYADNLDARQYDRRLRGPVDERRELGIDEQTGLKHYIASEQQGITTSAGMIRGLFRRSIELGRRYKESRDTRDFYEALRLLGTGCHCLEDYSAHSNYTELALIELGERNVFPHVGRDTQVRLQGARQPVYPIVTGTFGGVDFLHSVMGEFSDKATQSELQELEGTIQQSQNADTSMLKDLLDKLPSGILGDDDHKNKADQLQANAQAAQMENMHISPKDPEEFTQQMEEISKQIYPIMEFHDNLMKSISEAIDKIPVLPDLIEEIQNQVSLFVFSLLAPFVVPIINQVKNELRTGSSEIIQSSVEKQLIVFRDDRSSDPTHSMLSKDHFSNVLNEPAGKIASQVLKWVVPQIVQAWDNDDVDIRRTNDRIIAGVFHHPALREYGNDGASDGRLQMFGVVEKWWGEMSERERDDLRNKLSRSGVEQGRNHKPGVHDGGHGSCKPLGLPNSGHGNSSGAMGGALGGLNQALGGGSSSGGRQGKQVQSKISDTVGDAVGGGALGSIVGGVAGAVGAGLLGGAFGGDKSEKKTYKHDEYEQDGSYNTRITETGHRPGGYGQEERYGQAQMSQTQFSSGGYQETYQRYEQDGRQCSTDYGYQQTHEVRPTHDGGYQERTERRYEHPGGRYEGEVTEQRVTSSGRQYGGSEAYSGRKKKDDSDDDDDDDSNDDDDYEKKQKKQRKKEEKRRKKEREEEERRGGYGRRNSGSRERRKSKSRSRERRDSNEHKRQSGGYKRQSGGYQSERRDEYSSQSSYSRQEHSSESRFESSSSYGDGRQEYGSSGRGGGRQEYDGSQGYGGGQQEYGGGRQEYGGGQQEYGGGRRNDEDEYQRRDDNMPGGFGGSSGYGEQGGSGDGYSGGGYQERRY